MRCLFCKQDSSDSRSREHIIPESLGNVDHVLPAGVVCDRCNNYIARKIEKPILDSVYYRELRFHHAIPNKRDRFPLLDGFHPQSLTRVQVERSLTDGLFVSAHSETAEEQWVQSMLANQNGTLIFPIGQPPNDYQISRLIGKIGLEVLAQRALPVTGGLDEIIDKPELDDLRAYVRNGSTKFVWPVSRRRIYRAESVFSKNEVAYQVLHEYKILTTSENEYYIVVAIFGEEFALNLGGPEIDGYLKWLEQNDNTSPLYK